MTVSPRHTLDRDPPNVIAGAIAGGLSTLASLSILNLLLNPAATSVYVPLGALAGSVRAMIDNPPNSDTERMKKIVVSSLGIGVAVAVFPHLITDFYSQ